MKSFFVFDVESVGLHGEGFAVAGGVYLENGATQWEFFYACHPDAAIGEIIDFEWVLKNLPVITRTHYTPALVRDAFWNEWMKAKAAGALMAVECGWPVEGRFLNACIEDDKSRKWEGPYPMIEISTYLIAAGMDPMAKNTRTPSEMPEHNPLSDARLSARLLSEAISKIALLRSHTT